MAETEQDLSYQRARGRVGTMLRDKWKLDELLGLGGMAAVYSATHRNGKRAAVKMLHAQAAADPAVRARFLREGYVANQVAHPGAVSILDDDVDESGSVYLVMELLEGDTLEDLRVRSGGTIPAGDVLAIIDQALDVLAAAHSKKIVHRDIKPGNLFVTLEGTVKVLDFGIARLGDATQAPRSATTTFSSSMGTIGFMAPEQARGRWAEVDARTDLWSVGATMFELLSGRLVHEANTGNEQLLAAMTERAPPIAKCVPDVHDAVALVVDRALAYERAARWADASSMQEAVRAAYLALVGRPISEAPRLKGRPRVSVALVGQARTLPTLSASGANSLNEHGPMASRTREKKRPTGPFVGAIAAAVGLFAAIAAAAMLGGRVQPKPTVSGVGPTAAAQLVTADPSAAPAVTPIPTVAAPAAAAAVTASVVISGARSALPPRPHAPRPAPSATAVPSGAPVDIFVRRQ